MMYLFICSAQKLFFTISAKIAKLALTGSAQAVVWCPVMKTRDVEEKEIREENQRIRFLRFLVDLSIASIQQDDLLPTEALRVVEDVKRAVCNLFPGKEETFELIYRPRFQRAIYERFGLYSTL